MVEEHEGSALEAYPENSFQRIFWEEQKKASGLKDKRPMRWHPMFIRWCLYLRHVSSRAYDVLRRSGYIVLPSQRTLRDYTQCDVIVSSSSSYMRCVSCTKHRKTLLSSASRIRKSTADIDRTHPSSRTKYTSLTTPEKHQRLQRLHSELRKTNKQIERLREKVAVLIMDGQEEVDQELDSDIREMVEEHEGSALEAYPENSFQRIFWEEQKKASGLKDKRPMRWHPMFIRWCLYLRHVSSRAYDVLRRSGYIVLPSQRTLRDYTHYASAKIGFCDEVDRLLGCVLSMSAVDFLILEALDNSVFLCLVQDTQRIYELELLTITSH